MGKLEETLKQITPLRKMVRAIKELINYEEGNAYTKHRKALEKKDRQNAAERPDLIPLHKTLHVLKFEIMSKYFKLIDYKMGKVFYTPDIDKLFAVFKKLDKPGPIQDVEFKLSEARHKYTY